MFLILAYLNLQVPWTDLRYLFGEIMYGGHITDDWDRRLCKTYLEEYMKPEMVCHSALLWLHLISCLTKHAVFKFQEIGSFQQFD